MKSVKTRRPYVAVPSREIDAVARSRKVVSTAIVRALRRISNWKIRGLDMSDSIPSGVGSNGTKDLTTANTWYQIPSTIPSSDYVLVATIENNVGTVRWGFDGTGTPSASNGNIAPSMLTIRLSANQSLYYASSSAGDDVNWTTKVI